MDRCRKRELTLARHDSIGSTKPGKDSIRRRQDTHFTRHIAAQLQPKAHKENRNKIQISISFQSSAIRARCIIIHLLTLEVWNKPGLAKQLDK